MRKYLLSLLAMPVILSSQTVISTETDLTAKEKYVLTQSPVSLYYQTTLTNPNVYQDTVTYADAALTQVAGKLLKDTPFQTMELYVNEAGTPIFKLRDGHFLPADKRIVFDDQIVSQEPTDQQVWLSKDFTIYDAPLVNGVKKVSTKLTPYSKVHILQLAKTFKGTFAYIEGVGWINAESISVKDTRIEKVQELLTSKHQKDNLAIFVKQVDNDLTAGVNQDKKMYSASITKLLYLYYAQKQLNAGSFTLKDPLRYTAAVNDFKGAYDPSGSGSLPKKDDDKDYTVEDVINRTAKESDNVGSNLLGYYLTDQSNSTFQEMVDQISGQHWDVENRDASARMAGQMMEALYHQGGYVVEALSQTSFDQQRIPKDISVKVAHKIGDAYDFKHDVAIVYTSTPFVLSIFTEKSDYETISQIAKEVYEVLK